MPGIARFSASEVAQDIASCLANSPSIRDLSIEPKRNLVSDEGFGEDASRTTDDADASVAAHGLS